MPVSPQPVRNLGLGLVLGLLLGLGLAVMRELLDTSVKSPEDVAELTGGGSHVAVDAVGNEQTCADAILSIYRELFAEPRPTHKPRARTTRRPRSRARSATSTACSDCRSAKRAPWMRLTVPPTVRARAYAPFPLEAASSVTADGPRRVASRRSGPATGARRVSHKAGVGRQLHQGLGARSQGNEIRSLLPYEKRTTGRAGESDR